MGVDNEARPGILLIDLCVNTLLGGRLDAAAPFEGIYCNFNDIVGGKADIGLAARSDDKGLVIHTAAHVAPSPCDKAGLDQLLTRLDNELFSSQNIHDSFPFGLSAKAGNI